MDNKVIKFIAANQVIGGGLGLPVLAYMAYQLFNTKPELWQVMEARCYFLILYTCVASFFIASLIAGIYLYKGRVAGLWMSRFVQLAQVPSFAFSQISYFMGVGLNLFLNVTCNQQPTKSMILGLNISTNFPLNFNITTMDNVSGVISFGLNIVAFIFCYLLIFSKYKNSIR